MKWLWLPFVVVASAAQSLDFKGNSLGMDLRSFKKTNHVGNTVINGAVPNWRGYINKKLDKQVPLPLCSDDLATFPGSERVVAPGEILCNASPWGWYEGKTLLDKPITGVYYRFYNDRLYAIELEFDQSRFAEITDAFKVKYGNPTESGAENNESAFGAQWASTTIVWIRDKQAILAREGPAGGPAQRVFAPGTLSRIVFLDPSLAPPHEKPKIDF